MPCNVSVILRYVNQELLLLKFAVFYPCFFFMLRLHKTLHLALNYQKCVLEITMLSSCVCRLQ